MNSEEGRKEGFSDMTKTNASRPGAPHWLRGGDERLVNR